MGENTTPIPLQRINLQYWFNGPENTPDTSDALSLFTMDCLDTTLGDDTCTAHTASKRAVPLCSMQLAISAGCAVMYWNITQGLGGVEGARYVLNIGFKSKSGILLNETSGSG